METTLLLRYASRSVPFVDVGTVEDWGKQSQALLRL